jgi:hypothetical protein
MALDKYLITKTDILTFRPTADLDEGRIKPFILEAQRLDLKPVLNDALYYDFVLKFDAIADPMYTVYQELLSGKEYSYNGDTIYFDGVKPMLAYFSLARFVVSSPVNITRLGIVTKLNAQSEPADAAMIKAVVNELRSAAIGYQHQVIQFLETKASTYPLYSSGGGSENIGTRNSFNFFRL